MSSATNWPNSIHSRHHQIRKRAQAYASALYYSECSISGISPDGAATAEETARSRHSRWWLKGSDPNHPAHAANSADEKISAEEGNPKPADQDADQIDPNPNYDDSSHSTDEEENDESVHDQEEEDDEDVPLDDDDSDDSNMPIMARDDDLGSSFGALSSFSPRHNNMPVLPSWLMSHSPPRRVTPPSSSHVLSSNQAIVAGSTEEMLRTYSLYPNLLSSSSSEMKQGPTSSSTIPPPLAAVAQQVTSESEGDHDSIYSISSGGSSSSSFSIQPRHHSSLLPSTIAARSSSRKRVREVVDDFSTPLDQTYLEAQMNAAKMELLSALEKEGSSSTSFQAALAKLETFSRLVSPSTANKKRRLDLCSNDIGRDSDDGTTNIDGTWLSISSPEYPSSLGKNANRESLFTLGRMTFDMYQPSNLVCSIQKQYNTIKSVETKDLPKCVPKSLRREVEDECNSTEGRLRTYNIIASFTIERDNETGESKNLQGIMTNYGYALPDPNLPGRKSIWFSGGTIEPADDDSLDEWTRLFGAPCTTNDDTDKQHDGASEDDTAKVKYNIDAEKARILASKILLGAVHEPMDEEGTIGYHLLRPIGGHGSAYVDTVYMDDELRVMRGHSGSIYVFKRV